LSLLHSAAIGGAEFFFNGKDTVAHTQVAHFALAILVSATHRMNGMVLLELLEEQRQQQIPFLGTLQCSVPGIRRDFAGAVYMLCSNPKIVALPHRDSLHSYFLRLLLNSIPQLSQAGSSFGADSDWCSEHFALTARLLSEYMRDQTADDDSTSVEFKVAFNIVTLGGHCI
jgi:hypothetical protein